MQIDTERLKSENTNLVAAFREKNRKHQQTQELYDRLKRKEMTAATRSAAFESADQVLGNGPNRQGQRVNSQHSSAIPRSEAQHEFQPLAVDRNGVEQAHTHQRGGSNNSPGSGEMMPPPLRRAGRLGANNFDLGICLPPLKPCCLLISAQETS